MVPRLRLVDANAAEWPCGYNVAKRQHAADAHINVSHTCHEPTTHPDPCTGQWDTGYDVAVAFYRAHGYLVPVRCGVRPIPDRRSREWRGCGLSRA